jgi:TPR repeat protein
MFEIGQADLCAFCRTPCAKSDKEQVKRIKKLMEKGNAEAYNMLANSYSEGVRVHGLPQNWAKANELWLKAGELGCAYAYYNLGNAYRLGRGVDVVEKKAKYYYELAAMMGSVKARHNLGVLEGQAGNLHRAVKHYILAAKAGNDKALNAVKNGFMAGYVTKDDYASTLRAYQMRADEMKSDARDKARAFLRTRQAG